MSDALREALASLAGQPPLQAALAALATFVLEDAATLACAALVAAGAMGFGTAFAGLAVGIAVGDVGLYLIGRGATRLVVARGWLTPERIAGLSDRFAAGAVPALLASRFVPGARLPTYLAAGALRVPLSRFVAVVVVASVAWVGGLLALAQGAGGPIVRSLHVHPAVVVLAVVAATLAPRAWRLARRSGRGEARPARVASRFELWPPWIFYAPVAAWYALLALRYRSLLLPSAANPSIHAGGLLGESKAAVLDLVTGSVRDHVAPYVLVRRRAGASRDELARDVTAALSGAGLALPVVGKPDLGMRGAGVRPCFTLEDVVEHVAAFPEGADVMLQELVGASARNAAPETDDALPERLRGVREAGVLWARDPDTGSASIVSLTLKRPVAVVGDGLRTLGELVDADPRARLLRRVHRERHAERLGWVPGRGERVPLVFAGNHCRGALFFDGRELATPELLRAVDRVARSMPGFHFGRFDVCFDDPVAFLRGEELRIVEINGAGGEATHVWDPATRLRDAWSDLRAQWTLLFRIGAAQRRRGARPVGVGRFLRDVMAHRRLVRRLPVTR